jgi:hypothetical protein
LGPTDFNERETTHFGWFRHAAAKALASAGFEKPVYLWDPATGKEHWRACARGARSGFP